MNLITTIAVALTFGLVPEPATQPATQPAAKVNPYVLVVGGIHRDPAEGAMKNKIVDEFRKLMVTHGNVDPNRVTVLAEKEAGLPNVAGQSDAETLTKTFETLAKSVKPDDTFIFYYAGQANLAGQDLRMNLPGPDIIHTKLVEMIRKVPAGRKLVILDCPYAGLLVKQLADKGTIVLCGARSDQPYSPRFGSFFLPALVEAKNDTDGNGKVSLLEAFTMASQQIEEFFKAQQQLMTEIPLLEDDGDGIPSQQPWAYKESKKDGLAASQFHLLNGIPGMDAITIRPPVAALQACAPVKPKTDAIDELKMLDKFKEFQKTKPD